MPEILGKARRRNRAGDTSCGTKGERGECHDDEHRRVPGVCGDAASEREGVDELGRHERNRAFEYDLPGDEKRRCPGGLAEFPERPGQGRDYLLEAILGKRGRLALAQGLSQLLAYAHFSTALSFSSIFCQCPMSRSRTSRSCVLSSSERTEKASSSNLARFSAHTLASAWPACVRETSS